MKRKQKMKGYVGGLTRLLVCILAVVLALPAPLAQGAYAETYISDLEDFKVILFEDQALALNELGLFAGTSTTAFVPNLSGMADREQAVKLIALALDWEIKADAKTTFTDVSAWAQPYVAKAVELGAVGGIGNNKFGGKDPITGQQLSAILLRLIGYDKETAWNDASTYAGREFGISLDPVLERALNRDRLVGILYYFLRNAEPLNADYSYMEKMVLKNDAMATIAKKHDLISKTYSDQQIDGTLGKSPLDILSFKSEWLGVDVRPFVEKLITDKTGAPFTIQALEDASGGLVENLEAYAPAEAKYAVMDYTTRFGSVSLSGTGGKYAIRSMDVNERGYFSIYGYDIGDKLTSEQIDALNLEEGWFSFDTITHSKALPEIKKVLYMSFQYVGDSKVLVGFSITNAEATE